MNERDLTVTFITKTGVIKDHVCVSGAEARLFRRTLQNSGRLILRCCQTCKHFVGGTPDSRLVPGDPDECEHPTAWIAQFNFAFPFEHGCIRWEPCERAEKTTKWLLNPDGE